MKIVTKWFALLLVVSLSLWAQGSEKMGTVSIFIIKDGKPLVSNEVIIDGEKSYKTDGDGWVEVNLPVGTHQLQVFGKEKEGMNLGYIKKPFIIKSKRDTQIIASFTEDQTLDAVTIDTPKVGAVDIKKTTSADAKGTLSGQVLSSQGKKPIKDARIFVKGTAIDTRTDANGRFSVKVPADSNLSISVVHSAFSSQTLSDILVAHNKSVTKKIELTPAGMELEEFVVLAPKVEGSIASAFSERKNTSTVADILGAEQMSKAGDSSAAGALKKVTGITLVGGKYVYIRGLGERYSSTLLNNLHLPSPEPTKRVVPLDMFPTSVIGSMMIQKTYTPDLPGTFGGGTIKIRTKGTPDDFFLKMGLDLSYKDGATFEDGTTYDGGDSDYTGYDDGSRELPPSLLNATQNFTTLTRLTDEQVKEIAKDLINKRKISTSNESLKLGSKLSIAFGDSYSVTDDIDVGYTASYSYGSSSDRQEIRKVSYKFTNGKTDGSISSGGDNDVTTYNYKHGGMLGLSADMYENHKLKYTLLYILDSQDLAKLSTYHSNSADLDFQSTYLRWVERELTMNQFNGEHIFNDAGRKLEWGVEYGTARRYEPGTIEYDYERVGDTNKYVLSTSVSSPVSYSTNELNDDLVNMKMSYKEPISFFEEFVGKDFDDYVEVGGEYLTKNRELESRIFSFTDGDGNNLGSDVRGEIDDILNAEAIDDDVWELGNRFLPGDYYDAEQNLNAYFLKYHAQPIDQWEILVGARYETSTQSLTTFALNGTRVLETEKELESKDLLPAITVTYKATDQLQIRAGYSKSITRPDFREFSENNYQDPITGEVVFGNPELDYTKLNNIDARIEYYFSDTENVSFAAFYKSFNRPIETVLQEQGRTTRTFANAESAESLGLEVDFRKNLDFVDERLSNFLVSGNAAYIDSSVTLDKENKDYYNLTTDDRPMQGQSPYVINLGLGYDNRENGRSVNIAYNVFGKRIRALGTDEQPDYYEMPFHQLDFIWIEKIANAFKIKLKAKNILDSQVEWEQDGIVSYSKKPGREFGLGFSYNYK